MGSSAIQSHAPAPTPPVPSGILGSTSAWFSWCCSSQDTLRWSTPLLISSLVSGSLKHSLPTLSLCALCSAYFCDLRVAEIFVELNYFYTSLFMWPAFWGLFPLAGGWERPVHRGVLRASGIGVPCSVLDAPSSCPGDLQPGGGMRPVPTFPHATSPKVFSWRWVWLRNSDSQYGGLEGLGLTLLEEQFPPAVRAGGEKRKGICPGKPRPQRPVVPKGPA